MSYSFDMYFTPASSLAQALKKAQEYTEIMSKTENLKKAADDEIYYFPSVRLINSSSSAEAKSMAVVADDYFMVTTLLMRFVYFPEAKLLALNGFGWPEADKFFKKRIGFQNSCDQDYDRSDWKGIKFFEKIFDEFAQMSAEDLVNTPEGKTSLFSVEDMRDKESLEYYQRSCAYSRIFRTLGLMDWLYGDENPAFKRITMCPVMTQEQQAMLYRYVRGLIQKG